MDLQIVGGKEYPLDWSGSTQLHAEHLYFFFPDTRVYVRIPVPVLI